MSKSIEVKFDSVIGGIAPAKHLVFNGQYSDGLGVDPEQPVRESDTAYSEDKPGAVIRSVSVAAATKTNIDAAVTWFILNPKDTKTYVYSTTGELLSYTNTDLTGTPTSIGTATSGNGSGAAYYNNYIYLATTTNISRYGPLDNSPSLSNTVWTTATLGSQTALTDTTYPTTPTASASGVELHNHAMHVHDNKGLYFCDFKNGFGMIHNIITSKTTDEGDTDNGSAYNVLDLPFGYYPTDIESYGTDLVIAATQTSSKTLYQGQSALFFWNTTDSNWYRRIPINLPIISALYNNNGTLYIFGGSTGKGAQVLKYLGGQSTSTVAYLPSSHAPLAGAITARNRRIFFGGTTKESDGTAVACVYALGTKLPIERNPLHCVLKTSASADDNAIVTALESLSQAEENATAFLVVAWDDDTTYGLDSVSGTAGSGWVRSPFYMIGEKFKISKIRVPIFRGPSPASADPGRDVDIKVFFDGDSTTGSALTTVSNATHGSSELVIFKPPAQANMIGNYSFMIEVKVEGMVSVVLPVTIELETMAD